MKKKNIDNWLKNEVEKLDKEIKKFEAKIQRIMRSEDINALDKANQWYIQLRELKATQNKLYEMLGRLGEIECIED
ncbi:MAG: hypothetical protein K0R54_165 [Clostridiaceae bacterium]|jgi:uncharacterized protein YacL (UPF0231 family)|nr:hypothetical protein [Clostridiaceae bacterium]